VQRKNIRKKSNKALAHVETVVRVRVLERRSTGWKSVCIR